MQEILTWLEQFTIYLTAKYILGNKNILADQLSHPDHVIPTKWSLLPWMFNTICKEFGVPFIDLFATRTNAKLHLHVPSGLHLHVSSGPHPIVWKEDTFQHGWDDLIACLPSICYSKADPVKCVNLLEPLCDLGSFYLSEKEWFANFFSVGGCLSHTSDAVESVCLTAHTVFSQRSGVAETSCLETVK